MIVLLRDDMTTETSRELVARIRALDLEAVSLDLARGRALEVIGDDPSRVLSLQDAAGVQEILTRRTPLAGGEPIWPHVVLRVLIAVLLSVILLALLTAFLPPGLSDRAGSSPAEGPARVEWYLRPLSALIDMFPAGGAWMGGWLVFLFWALLFLWPFLDRADAATRRGAAQILVLRLAGVAALVVSALLALGVVG